MMELRFVYREKAIDQNWSAKERILQFRVKEGPRGEDWWSEWKDVPLVEDEDE